MSVCAHDPFCPGVGGAHDAATLGVERLVDLRRQSKPLIRSGNPRKRAVGKALLARIQAAFPYLPEKEDES